MPTLDNSPAVAGAAELRRIYGICATRTYDARTNTATIDFGSTNCLCSDGRYCRGKIIIAFTIDIHTRRAGTVVTREGYFVNDNQHTAIRTFDLGGGSFTVAVTNASIIRANNDGTHYWTVNKTATQTAGYGTVITSDDVQCNRFGQWHQPQKCHLHHYHPDTPHQARRLLQILRGRHREHYQSQ